MFEKVNPMHPDKVADRIAGALVDYAYRNSANGESPKIAVEVLIGHGECNVIAETSVHIPTEEVCSAVARISKEEMTVHYVEVPQDVHLADNQNGKIRCGDNGIFKGVPVSNEQKALAEYAHTIYNKFPTDGKYILDAVCQKAYFCQSNATNGELNNLVGSFYHPYFTDYKVNPLGEWTGGTSVDSGATNRKLGSDMGDSVTGGGLCGKDYSKADVSVNIACFLFANESGAVTTASCAIGDEEVPFKVGDKRFTLPYSAVVAIAKDYIDGLGGFEKFAEWGLIR